MFGAQQIIGLCIVIISLLGFTYLYVYERWKEHR